MNKHAPTIRTLLLTVTAAAALATTARAQFTPLTIDTNSFNQDVVIEKTAPLSLNDVVNCTVDQGTNKGGNVWFERGYNTQAPLSGLPPAGSTFTTNNHTWQMPPDYHTNNVIMVGRQNGSRTPNFPRGTLTLTAPAIYTQLSFLAGAGNGPVTVRYTIRYVDGSTDSPATFQVLDWFNGGPPKEYNCAGRVSLGGGVQNIGASPGGLLFKSDVLVGNPSLAVSNIDFELSLGNNSQFFGTGRATILAVSGSTDGTTYTAVPVSGFNYDAVVEADAPTTTGFSAIPQVLTNNTYITATMDGGLAKTGNTWYEQGYYTNFPNTGIPAAGATISSHYIPATFTMPPAYTTNCAVAVGGANSSVSNRTINFTAPTSAGALSFLCGAANGDTILQCIISYSGGASETNYIFVPDWFNRNVPWSYFAFGRINPSTRSLNSTAPEFVDPFWAGLGKFDYRGLTLPVPHLFDAVVQITNTSPITSVTLLFTNGPASTRFVSIFAVSGAPIGSVPPVFGTQGSPVLGQPNNVGLNYNVSYWIKRYEGTNNIVLAVTNIAGSGPLSYQWKKMPRGNGFADKFYTPQYFNSANLTDGGRISGSTSNILTVSNAVASADSADYFCVVSNPSGSLTSLVTTVMLLTTTNQNMLVGVAGGDTIANYTGDNGSPTAESLDHVIDQVAQKWLSFGFTPGQQFPWQGPVGYIVTPVSGASIVTAIRFWAANDSAGRDPFDYALDGSNDGGTSWTPITGGVLKGSLSMPNSHSPIFVSSAALDPLSQTNLEVNFPNSTGYASYRVTLTNNYNGYADGLMQIGEIQLLGTLVPNPPVWVRQPNATAIVFQGANPSATVQASGNPNPKYQWYTNIPPGLPVAATGATNATYTLLNIQAAQNGINIQASAANTFGTITSTPLVVTVTNQPSETYPTIVSTDNAIGYWRLNEFPDDTIGNNGLITHDYRGAHNGYYSNAVINVAGYNPTYDVDTATAFNGGGANSLVDGIRDLSFEKSAGSSQFSVEAWVLGGNQTTDAGIVSKGYNGILNAGTGTGTEQFVLDVTGGNPRKFRFLVRDAAGNGHVAQSTIVPYDPLHLNAMWHHLLGVCDQTNGSVYLYVDGLLAGTGSIANNVGVLSQALPMTIGARRTGGTTQYDQQWVGSIDDVAIYNKVLTPAQALNHYYAGLQPPIITLQPTNQTLPENVTATFASSAYGAGTLGFQWYFSSDGGANFNPAPGQTSSNLVFTTAAAQDQYQFELVATNQYGSSTGAVVTLTVVSGAPSFIVDLPATANYLVGHVIQLQVIAGGTAPFTYGWTTNGVLLSDNYRISGSHTPNLVMAYAALGDTANYQCWVTNGSGLGSSAVCAVTVTNVSSSTAVPFNVGGTGWQLNGTTLPIMGLNRLELTSGLGNTARSAFMLAQQSINTFNAAFVYQTVSGINGADGVTFCIQNDPRGATAPQGAGGGGGLGYTGTSPSVALAFNIYDPNTRGIRFQANGAVNPPFVPIAPVLLGGNANPIQVNVNYAGGVVTATFKDTITAATYTTNQTVDIPGIVGGGSAYVGFTGADGGVASTQVISNFVMFPPPVKLTAVRSGSNLQLTWPSAAGAYLMSSPTLSPPAWINDTSDTFQLVNNGNTAQVLVPISGAAKFYRLQVFP